MDISPWRTPEVPPKTGSSANSKPTAQSWEVQQSKDASGRRKVHMDKLSARKRQWNTTNKRENWRMSEKNSNLQNKSSNGNLPMKGVSRILFHQEFQYLHQTMHLWDHGVISQIPWHIWIRFLPLLLKTSKEMHQQTHPQKTYHHITANSIQSELQHQEWIAVCNIPYI